MPRTTRPRKGARDLTPLAAFLGRSLSPRAMEQINLGDLVTNWDKVVGSVLAKRSRPAQVEDRVLVVACESPAVAHEILMRRAIVTEKAKKGWGIDLEGVKPVVRRLPAPRSAGQARKAPEAFKPSPPEVEKAKTVIAGKIANPELETALARLMATFRRRFNRGKD